MLRFVVRYHTIILALASMTLLVIPGPILVELGVASPSLGVMALTRVIACLLGVLAAAVLFVPELPARVRGSALLAITASYCLTFVIVLLQQIAIWNTALGWGIVAAVALHVAAFAWCSRAEYRYPMLRI